MTSHRVLTMEFCEGGRADDLNYMIDNNIPVEEVCTISQAINHHKIT